MATLGEGTLEAALVIVGYALTMAGVERYSAVAKAVESTSDGTVKVSSPRLMKSLAVVLQVVLGVVIDVFLLGPFEAADAA